MKKFLLSAVSLALLTNAAIAADLPSRKAEPLLSAPPPPQIWTGFYAGLNAGYNAGLNSSAVSSNIGGTWNGAANNPWINGRFDCYTVGTPLLNAASPISMNGVMANNQSGFIGGGQIGYNYQLSSLFVVGIEADIDGAAINGASGSSAAPTLPAALAATQNVTQATGFTQIDSGLEYLGTVHGRIGYLATAALLAYGSGGFAYGGAWATASQRSAENFTSETGRVFHTSAWTGAGSQNQLLTGWTAGGGLEWLFAPNWSLKAEALYWNLGNLTVRTVQVGITPDAGSFYGNSGWGNTSLNYAGIAARAGVNYHFNSDAAPVVAKF
jgi:outer membrane immunogenic protein